MLSQQNPDIKRAAERLADLSADQQARMEYEAHLRYLRDQATQEYGVREEGRVEGGRLKTLEIARALLQLAYPLDNIIKATGLSKQEIEALQLT